MSAPGWADVGAFVARLLRMDAAAVVRLRPSGPPSSSGPAGAGLVQLWGRLPFDVLVTRTVRLPDYVYAQTDVTFDGAALLAMLAGPVDLPAVVRRDADWRWSLPPGRGRPVEALPASVVRRVSAAAAATLREATTPGVAASGPAASGSTAPGGAAPVRHRGERAVRDALLDHVPIVVTDPDGQRVEVSQRLVQALVRMGFVANPLRSKTDTARTSVDTLGEQTVTVYRAASWVGLEALYGSAWYRRPISVH